jgi:hypothetical protein
MKTDFFLGSKLKIKRANKHIAELNRVLRSLRESGGHQTHMEFNRQTRELDISYEAFVSKQAIDEIAPILGDVVHNLASALDLVVYELIRLCGRNPNRLTKFPFEESREKVIAAIKGRAIQRLPLRGQTFLIQAIQSDNGGNDPIGILHDLDITDKHHTLIPVWAAPVWPIHLKKKGKPVERIVLASKRSGDVCKVRVPADTDVKKYGKRELGVSFHDIEGLDKPVIPTLLQLSHLVAEIVEKITALWTEWAALQAARKAKRTPRAAA